MALEAGTTSDEETRQILAEDAKEAALAWRCPRVCKSGDALDADHAEALGAVESLTGHKFKTCPYAGAWQPWVHRVVNADEHGLADDQIAHGAPPRALVEAVQVVRRAKRRRDAEEARVAREESRK